MPERKPLSKKLRFEIFKRDAFTCQYCGSCPPAVVLEIDHIEPVAGGGESHELNLITSCKECNAGKGARVLGDVKPRPDAAAALLEVQQEIEEARHFLLAYDELERYREAVADTIRTHWIKALGSTVGPSRQDLSGFLAKDSPEDIIAAIDIMSAVANKLNGPYYFNEKLAYVGGILRRWRTDGKRG